MERALAFDLEWMSFMMTTPLAASMAFGDPGNLSSFHSASALSGPGSE